MADETGPPIIVQRTYRADVTELWSLWTTKEGFESWWGPEQFRVHVHRIEAWTGGAIHYDMIADTAETVAAMARMGAPTVQPCRGVFSLVEPLRYLVLTQAIDFLPGVPRYDSRIEVEFRPLGDGTVRMTVTLGRMHDAATTAMQQEGFASQLGKLDSRYGWAPD